MLKRAFKDFQKTMLLALTCSLPMSSAFSAPPSEPAPQPSRKAATIVKPVKLVTRAQTPDTDAKDDSVFDTKLTPSNVPMAPNCLDLPNTSTTPGTTSPNTMTPLPQGQFASTAQSEAPAFFGDNFNPGGFSGVVPGSLVSGSPFGIGLFSGVNGTSGQSDILYVRPVHAANNWVWNGTWNNTSPLVTNASNVAYVHNQEGHPVHGTFLTNSTGHAVSVIFSDFTLENTPPNYHGTRAGLTLGSGHYFAVRGVDLSHQVLNTIPGDTHQEIAAVSPGIGNAALAVGVADQRLAFLSITNGESVNIYSPSVAAGGIQKLVDNASPLPRDRVFFNYSYFANSSINVPGQGAVNINRFTPGFEKTFNDQRMSIEVRVPFATTIDSINLTGQTNTSDIKLGNQTTYLKALMYSDPTLAIAGGLGVQAPTASDTSYYVNGYSYSFANDKTTTTSPQEILHIKNQAVHLLPYMGAVYTPNERFFAQSVAQFDFSTNGNSISNAALYPVLTNPGTDPNTWVINSQTTGLSRAGVLQDTNFMYLSGNAGYWMYKTRNPYERGITGFAPTMELHYNQSLQRGDAVSGFYGNAGSGASNISNVNGVIGSTTVIGHNKYLSVAYVAPFTNKENRFFDGELRVMFNYYFGAPRVNPRFSNVPGQ